MTQFTLFTNVDAYYTALKKALQAAQHHIHLVAFAFDAGHIGRDIGHVLAQKAASGVAVHLMVDEVGLYVDNWRHGWRNRQLLAQLRTSGVEIDLFRPQGKRISQYNRLHCKFCTIDNKSAFIGGSNIGDYYLGWRDTNLQLVGDLGNGFVHLYASLRRFKNHNQPAFCPTDLSVAGMPLRLTIPGHRQDIRRALLTLILATKKAVYLRSWYFLPDREIMNALLSQAERGVHVQILFSHQTRIPPIDIANRHLCRQLTRAGAHIYRYHGRFMHAKEAWTAEGDSLIGSANIDRWALRTNFECSLQISSQPLARQLTDELQKDLACCQPAKRDFRRRFSVPGIDYLIR